MNNIFKEKKYLFIAFLLATIFSFLSMYKALSFGYWRDDWPYIWGLYVAENGNFFDGTYTARFYPISLLRLKIISLFLDTKPFGWHLVNIIFRVFASVSSGFVAYSITKSKKIFLLSTTFLAVGIAGVEPASFIGANNVTFFMIPLGVCVYFWVKSTSEQKINWTELAISLIFVTVLTKGEQWSYYVMPLVLLMWDILNLFHHRNRRSLVLLLKKFAILIIVLGITFYIPPLSLEGSSTLSRLKGVKVTGLRNLFSSLGRLILGSWFYTSESGGLSNATVLMIFSGAAYFATAALAALRFLHKPTKYLMAITYLNAWIIIFYLPNWIFAPTLTVGASHRYLAIPAIGLYIVFAILLARLPKKIMVLFVMFFIFSNIYSANKVLTKLGNFRSAEKIDNVIADMTKPIPMEQDEFLIFYKGDGEFRGYILDWSLGIPIAIARDIKDTKKFPIWVGNISKVESLLCGEDLVVNLIGGKGQHIKKSSDYYDLNNIYSYYIKDSGEVINNSDEFRSELSTIDCGKLNSEI